MIRFDDDDRMYVRGTRLSRRGERVVFGIIIICFFVIMGIVGAIE